MRSSTASLVLALLVHATPSLAQDQDVNACPWEANSDESVQRDSTGYHGSMLYLQSRFNARRGRYTYCVYNSHASALAYAEWGDDKDDLLFDLPVPAQTRVPFSIDSQAEMQSARQQFDFGIAKRQLTDTKQARTIYEAAVTDPVAPIRVAAPAGEIQSFAQTVPDAGTLFRDILSDPRMTREVFVDRLPPGGAVGVNGTALVFFPRDREIFDAFVNRGFDGSAGEGYVSLWVSVFSGLTRREDGAFITTFAAIFPGPASLTAGLRPFDLANDVRLVATGPTLRDTPTIALGELLAGEVPPLERRALLAEVPLRDGPIGLTSGRLRITGPDGQPIGSMKIPLLTQE